MAIDIGMPATDRASSFPSYTLVAQGNPANATGVIDTVEIWANANMTLCEVATFFVVSGNNLSTRDYEAIGSVTAGSKQTFTGLSIDVETGDYLGIYYATGSVEAISSGGTGLWGSAAGVDLIPTTNTLFTLYSAYELSLYGTGTEAATTQGEASLNAAKLMAAGAI